MRRTVTVALATLALAAAAHAAQPAPNAVTGLWRTAPDPVDGAAIVEIVRDGDTFRGRIVWLEKPRYGPEDARPGRPKTDLRNPDPRLRERPVLGLEILTGFRYRRGRWVGGTIYDPASGKTYRSTMRLQGPDRLKVRGYVGVSFLGRTEVWTRVDAVPPSGDAPAAGPGR